MEGTVGRDGAEELTAYCQDTIGEQLRAVTRYSSAEHDRVYSREGLHEELGMDDEARAMFRVPLMQLHKAVSRFANVHPTITEGESAVINYGDISVIQLPIAPTEGVIVTLDWTGPLPDDFVAECEAIVNGWTERVY